MGIEKKGSSSSLPPFYCTYFCAFVITRELTPATLHNFLCIDTYFCVFDSFNAQFSVHFIFLCTYFCALNQNLVKFC
jgi:hypothetical protein